MFKNKFVSYFIFEVDIFGWLGFRVFGIEHFFRIIKVQNVMIRVLLGFEFVEFI
jgi:hypothetical protein